MKSHKNVTLRKVTLRDVAQQANVSASTVSRALNGFEFVEESTRAVILEAAQTLGYKAKGLQAKAPRQKTVLMLTRSAVHDLGQEVSLAGVERRISNGVIDVCQAFEMPTRTQPINMTAEDALQLCQDPSLYGAIFLGGIVEPAFACAMQESRLPFVVAGAVVKGVDLDCVLADYADGAAKVVHHLVQMGRTCIGFVNGSTMTTSSYAKYKGFRLGLTLHNLAFESSRVQIGDFSSESGYAGTVQIMKDSPDVDAILYASDEMAIGGLHALKEQGSKVPDDVAVVGFHSTHAARFTDPPLTSVDVDLRQMGRIACRRLHQLHLDMSEKRFDKQPWTITVPTTLVVRKSA